MKEFLRKVGGGFLASLTAALLATALIAVLPTDIKRELKTKEVRALTVPPTFSPRQFPTQQLAVTRFSVNFNSCVYVSLTCSFKVDALPYNAYILRANSQVTTAWNAGTSAAIALGTASGGGQLVASAVTGPATGGGTASTIVAANVGVAATGNGIAQTGSNGGFDLWATILIVGALPTTGQTNYVLEWGLPNDGSCVYVALGATAPAC